jgi:hypothetical protein
MMNGWNAHGDLYMINGRIEGGVYPRQEKWLPWSYDDKGHSVRHSPQATQAQAQAIVEAALALSKDKDRTP